MKLEVLGIEWSHWPKLLDIRKSSKDKSWCHMELEWNERVTNKNVWDGIGKLIDQCLLLVLTKINWNKEHTFTLSCQYQLNESCHI